jgi:hypothetical protein
MLRRIRLKDRVRKQGEQGEDNVEGREKRRTSRRWRRKVNTKKN